MMQDVPKEIAAIKDYHAHVYYDTDSKGRAALLRKWVEERFTMRMGSWHDEPVGPHVQAMYQIAFAPEVFPTLVPFLMMNRMGLTVSGASAIRSPARRSHAECGVDGRSAGGEDRGVAGGG